MVCDSHSELLCWSVSVETMHVAHRSLLIIIATVVFSVTDVEVSWQTRRIKVILVSSDSLDYEWKY